MSTGVTPEFVRLSVGIEDVRDILADLDQALEVAVPSPELVGEVGGRGSGQSKRNR